MCGRYTLTRAEERELTERFRITEFCDTRLVPRFNIAPSQDVVAVIRKDGHNVLNLFKWGLIPSWVKDLKKTKPMINARIETIAEKPFFKGAIKTRRCLIPADGFFEWRERENGTKNSDLYPPCRQAAFCFCRTLGAMDNIGRRGFAYLLNNYDAGKLVYGIDT